MRAAPLNRRDLLLGGLMAATAGVAFARLPNRKEMAIGPKELDGIVPTRIGDWRFETTSGLILPPPDAMAAQIYDQQLARGYEPEAIDDTGAPLPAVMLMIAYGSSQDGMLQVHRPEVCYPASGFSLSETTPVAVPIGGGRAIPAMAFTASRELRNEQVLYWTRVGNALPRSWSEQRLAIVRSNLDRAIPDGVLVRLSVVTTGDDKSAGPALERFARALVAGGNAKTRRLLFGDGSALVPATA